MIAAVSATVLQELRTLLRAPGDALFSVAFFAIVLLAFPFAFGAEPARLRENAAGALWIAALLAALSGASRMFNSDHAEGVVEQWLLAPMPVLWVISKLVAHWLVAIAPLVLISPLAALAFGLQGQALGVLTLSLLLGTPTLMLLGALAAALTLGARGGSMLPLLLVMPFSVPVLIFGTGAASNAVNHIDPGGLLMLLGAFLLVGMALLPAFIVAALGLAVE